jgi:hypothetical protein
MSRGLHAWPAERKRRLAELWRDPTMNISAIARDLGVSRRTVIRRADYLSLARSADPHRALPSRQPVQPPGTGRVATAAISPASHEEQGTLKA